MVKLWHKYMWLLLLAIVLIFGYLLFRFVLKNAEDHPITFELFAALIGFALTVLTTSLLLHRQTEAELSKEENIQFLNLKMKIYLELIEQLHDVVSKRRITPEDVIELRMLNQKIAFIASPDVLKAFNYFVQHFAQLADKESIQEDDIDSLLDEMSRLAIRIRRDLFRLDSKEVPAAQLEQLVLSSNDLLDLAE